MASKILQRTCHRDGCDEPVTVKSANLCPAHQSEWRKARREARKARLAQQG